MHLHIFILTPPFSASGAVHLIGSLPTSWSEHSSRAKPKSETFATWVVDIKTFRAAKSRCTTFLASKYSIPALVSLKEKQINRKYLHIFSSVFSVYILTMQNLFDLF
jgi:hypothetical protein